MEEQLWQGIDSILGRIIRDCQSTMDENLMDSVQFRLDFLRNSLMRYEGHNHIEGISEVLELLEEAAAIAASAKDDQTSSRGDTPRIFTGSRGRPKYVVQKEQLESLLEVGFSVPLISSLLAVSKRTIERRMAEFGLSASGQFSVLSDTDLDALIVEILNEFPNAGYSRATGHLRARGIRVQRERIRSSMRRVNPEGVLLRSLELFTINRRKYNVPGPLSLWHVDGNHKLIRYDKFFCHSSVYGQPSFSFSNVSLYQNSCWNFLDV